MQVISKPEVAGTVRSPVVSAQKGFRGDIQGLRAVAVLLVVLYHLWPNRLSGGYVGVDVFFVISGFLITLHMYREVQSTGTLLVGRFWARRIRRLLPASFLVLLVALGAVVLFVPATMWEQTGRQVAASALYVQNWVLAFDAVDYMALDNVPTTAQHYWSLSVEEQFYLLWPLIMIGIGVFARRRGARAKARHGNVRAPWGWLMAGLLIVGGVSLLASVILTARDQSSAYFFTHTRAWEFAAGALVALLSVRRSKVVWMREHRGTAALGWIGLLAVLVAGVTFDEQTAFPGWIALVPVVGTALLLVVGTPGSGGGRGGVGRLLACRPAVFVGDVSYAVYLWHWPMIVVLPYVTGHSLTTVDKLGIIVVSIALAWLTKVLVEDPGRRSALLGASPWRSFVFALIGSLVLVGASSLVQRELDHRTAQAEEAATALAVGGVSDCVGPAALEDPEACGSATGDGAYVVPPEAVAQQNITPTYPDCQQSLAESAVLSCDLGADGDTPQRVIALVGDSHATQWFPAFDAIGKKNDWVIRTFTKASCPMTVAARVLDVETDDARQVSCETWKASVRTAIDSDPSIDTVVTTAYSSAYSYASPAGRTLQNPTIDGWLGDWDEWSATGHKVFVIRDIPRPQAQRVPNCLAADPANGRISCAVPRAAALPEDSLVDAASLRPDVGLIDVTDAFCDETRCYPVIGDLIAYRDASHLTAEYSRALAPDVFRQMSSR